VSAQSIGVSRMQNAEANMTGLHPVQLGSAYIIRLVLLLLLLAGELFHFGITLLPYLNSTLHGWWWPIIWNGRPLAEAIIGGLLATTFLSWPTFRAAFTESLREVHSRSLNFWLGVHLLSLALVALWLVYGMQGGVFTAIGATFWFCAGLVFLSITAIAWSGAIAPRVFWSHWLAGSRGFFAMGGLIGFLARSVGYLAQMLWPPLCHYTFLAVVLMLHALSVHVFSDPSQALIGTDRFAVWIAPPCSGLEGIALISIFIGAYLWLYRTDYRFPVALILIPIGIATVWIFNAVRITVLILIGQWFSDVAVTGFHSIAGWVLFNLTAFGVVGASRHIRWIIQIDEAESVNDRFRAPNPVLPYLAPLLLTIGVGILTVSFGEGFDAAYPVRVLVAAFALWCYRDRIGTALIEFSWISAGIGAVSFLLWTILTPIDRSADNAIAEHLHSMPIAVLTGWIIFRVIGAVVTTPLAEELAFRGYLVRRLIATDFASVKFDSFTWGSFIVSSVAFGVLHQSWIAGVASGALFALAMYRRGRLSDAITAHATANALLAIYIIVGGYWSLWT
jgi:exosortase E/protease (VPEID-CTERM system)